MKPFDPLDRATWPDLLTGKQMAAIWQLSQSSVNRLTSQGQFIQPAEMLGPRRWRKADVLRFIGEAA